jgi:hypothetical protein
MDIGQEYIPGFVQDLTRLPHGYRQGSNQIWVGPKIPYRKNGLPFGQTDIVSPLQASVGSILGNIPHIPQLKKIIS